MPSSLRLFVFGVLPVLPACTSGGPTLEDTDLGSTGSVMQTSNSEPTVASSGVSASASETGEGSTTGAADSSSDSTEGGESTGGSEGSSTDVGSESGTSTGGGSTTATEVVTLTVDKLGTGIGAVRSEPDGVLCGPTCEAEFEVGTMVTLTAQSNASSLFSGWSGGGCSGQDTCELVLEQDTIVQATFLSEEPNIVFVTSTEVAPMDIGGLDGADQLCADAANDAGLLGTYVAWLSTSVVDARDRLGGARGWVRPDGRPFADTVEDLTSHIDYYPPRLDAAGNDVAGASIITGTSTDGTGPFYSTFCADWTDDDAGFVGGGSADGGAGAWTQFYTYDCTAPRRLLCFGVDQDVAVEVDPVPGRAAFVSTAELLATAGIDAFDDACQAEADDAGLAGSFLAAVATSTASMASRFDTAGLPWVRPDGVAVVASADELDTLDHLRAPLVQAADGSRLHGERAWTGAGAAYETGPGQDACGDWGDPDIGNGWSALVTESEYWTTAGGRQSCASAISHVFCLEE